ncbi:MAG: hypothetical protein KH028_07155 [Oscillospiraceae bacterium]|nr:hypothetical protein [Oscillospiraceae bacterium]
MKRLKSPALLTLSAALLVGCAQIPPSSSFPSQSTPLPEPPAVSLSDPAPSVTADPRLLTERYADVEALPMLDLDLEPRVQYDDRTLILEDSIDNELEYLVYQLHHLEAAADFDGRLELAGTNETLNGVLQNEASQFQEGYYMTEVVLHRLTTLTREDLNRVQEHCKENILELLDTYDLTEYAVVEADLDWKYSEAAMEAGPQLDEGRYLRYFLLARTENVPEYRYYELFWDDFLV